MKDFLSVDQATIMYESEYFFVIEDRFPVSPGHCLIVSKALKEDYFALSPQEKLELTGIIDIVKGIVEKDHGPDGYNIGMNCGTAAGQSIMHFHCHVIPRYWGDMENPKGGVRYCIPEKGYY